MVRKFIFVALLLLPLLSLGQISVKSFKKLPMDMTARTFEPKQDQNGEVCAIIRVVTTEEGFAWEPDGFGIVDAPYKVGEYWLYVPGGAQRITIRHEKLGRLVNYHYPEPIEKGCVYEMELTTAKITTIVEEVLNNYLVISAEPSDAVIYFENKMVGVGAYQALCKPGVYTYRVESPLYHTEAGRIEMGTEKKTVSVSLKPAFGYLNISTEPENGAIITVDGERLNGVSPVKTERLKSGEHTVSVVKNMYRPTTQKVMVTDGQTTPLTLRMEPNFANLTVSTGTTGGEIYLNNVKVGDTQWTGRVNIGLNGVEVRKAHHRPAKQEIEAVAGVSKTVALEPTPIKGNLSVMTTPINASIRIAGKEYGTTPNIITGLLEGDYTIVLSKTGCATESRSVTISEGKTAELNVTLASGRTITLTSVPEGVDLWLDGKPLGKAPQTLDIGFGAHVLKGNVNGKSKDQFIEVTQGGENQFVLRFNHTCGEPLVDSRDGQKYATKLMKDGRCWMVENLRFGKCDNATFGQYSESSVQGKIASDYWGVCIASTQSGGGNLYNWQAAMNHKDAVYETSGNPSDGMQWQGICPDGWHLPSGGSTDEFQKLYDALSETASDIYPGTGTDGWRGVLGGYGYGASVSYAGSYGYYWSSTYSNTNNAYSLYFGNSGYVNPQGSYGKYSGFAVRCVKNY